MTDIEKIDAAAQAIHATFANRSGRARCWADLPPTLQAQYRDEATAALVAAGVIQPYGVSPHMKWVKQVQVESDELRRRLIPLAKPLHNGGDIG